MTKETNQIAEAILRAAHLLGKGNAHTPMGAIELLASAQKDGLQSISYSLENVAAAIEHLAEAVSGLKDDT